MEVSCVSPVFLGTGTEGSITEEKAEAEKAQLIPKLASALADVHVLKNLEMAWLSGRNTEIHKRINFLSSWKRPSMDTFNRA